MTCIKMLIQFSKMIVFTYTFFFLNLSYSQSISKIRAHEECINTRNGLIKVNILDHSKKQIEVKEYLQYSWFTDNKIHTTIGGYNGKLLHGLYTNLYGNGNLSEQGNYSLGLKTGIWKKWDANGNLIYSARYKNGFMHGNFREYDENGNMKISCKYRNGLLNGSYRIYKANSIALIKHYKKGSEISKQHRIKHKTK